MSPVCSHCGRGFPPGRTACPHCGAEEAADWQEDDEAVDLDLPEAMDEDAYADFLADEGLAPAPPGRRRPGPFALALGLLAALAISGLAYLLFL
jgi:hypothetical protein